MPAPSSRALPRDLDVVEGKDAVADDLALLVALAGEQHDVVGAGLAQSPAAIASRRPPISVASGAPAITSRADDGADLRCGDCRR